MRLVTKSRHSLPPASDYYNEQELVDQRSILINYESRISGFSMNFYEIKKKKFSSSDTSEHWVAGNNWEESLTPHSSLSVFLCFPFPSPLPLRLCTPGQGEKGCICPVTAGTGLGLVMLRGYEIRIISTRGQGEINRPATFNNKHPQIFSLLTKLFFNEYFLIRIMFILFSWWGKAKQSAVYTVLIHNVMMGRLYIVNITKRYCVHKHFLLL